MVRRNLAEWLHGRRVIDLSSSGRHRGIQSNAIGSIVGSRIDAIGRIGKYLTCHTGPDFLVVHLGMSGRFGSYEPSAYVAGVHDHVRIATDDGKIVVFQDHRRFGRMFMSPADLSTLPPLGPDALNGRITARRLAAIFRQRSGQLKSLLMNQSVIAGLGNIYACEVLWAARLSPYRRSETLEDEDYRRLSHALADVLARAINAGGSTLDDYRNTTGAMGDFDRYFSVYARNGTACNRCGCRITAEPVNSRVTYWCAGCQI
jgi:formamidopyrimidine-DNA glycosylase